MRWRDSPVPLMRTGFQALRKAALAFAHLLPGRWDAIGYPGPLGARGTRPAPRLDAARGRRRARARVRRLRRRLRRRRRRRGRGAGRGGARRRRARGGRLLRRGATSTAPSCAGCAGCTCGGGGCATHDQSVGLLAGTCLGGGTVVNYMTSFRTPDDVREEWGAHGFPLPADYDAEPRRGLRAARRQQEHNLPSPRDEAHARAASTELGWHVDAMPRNVRRLRPGRGLRLLRLRLPPRREAVDGEDVAARTPAAPARGSSSDAARGGCSSRTARPRRRRAPRPPVQRRARRAVVAAAARSTRRRCSCAPG